MSGRRGLNLSAAQIIASVLATLSAAVAASFLGVAGTLVGAAVGSLVSTMGTEIYKHYLQRSEERLRSAGQVLYHSAARTRTGSNDVQAAAASSGRHAAHAGSAGQQGVTRDLGNRDGADRDPANQETAVWDRRQYGTPRDPHQTQMIPGSGTQWDSAANGGATNGSPNGWNGSGNSAGQHAHGSITPEGADGDAAGHGSVWAAVTSFFSDLTRRQWLTYGGIAADVLHHRHSGHHRGPARRGQAAAEQPGRPRRAAAAAADHAPDQHAVRDADRVHAGQPDILAVAVLGDADADADLGDTHPGHLRHGVLTLDAAVADPEHGQQWRGQVHALPLNAAGCLPPGGLTGPGGAPHKACRGAWAA